MVTEAKIKEIFESIQGEGSVVGYRQLFIRFCGCNLACEYCDTDFDGKNSAAFSPKELADKIKSNYDLKYFHSVSLTGGEPLLYADFISDFIDEIKKFSDIKIYLETNATLTDELLKIKDKIDIISADIKLPSSTGKDTFRLHEAFIQNCADCETFAKIVFDENITDDEITECVKIAKLSDIELILQPRMNRDYLTVDAGFCLEILNKFLKNYPKVRLIPQTHKFLNVR